MDQVLGGAHADAVHGQRGCVVAFDFAGMVNVVVPGQEMGRLKCLAIAAAHVDTAGTDVVDVTTHDLMSNTVLQGDGVAVDVA